MNTTNLLRAAGPLAICLDIHRPDSGVHGSIRMTPMDSSDLLRFATQVVHGAAQDVDTLEVWMTAIVEGVAADAVTWMDGEIPIRRATHSIEDDCHRVTERIDELVQLFAEGFYASAIRHGHDPNCYTVQVPSLAAAGNCIYVLINAVTLSASRTH